METYLSNTLTQRTMLDLQERINVFESHSNLVTNTGLTTLTLLGGTPLSQTEWLALQQDQIMTLVLYGTLTSPLVSLMKSYGHTPVIEVEESRMVVDFRQFDRAISQSSDSPTWFIVNMVPVIINNNTSAPSTEGSPVYQQSTSIVGEIGAGKDLVVLHTSFSVGQEIALDKLVLRYKDVYVT